MTAPSASAKCPKRGVIASAGSGNDSRSTRAVAADPKREQRSVYNFSAGPACLPVEVLQKAQARGEADRTSSKAYLMPRFMMNTFLVLIAE